MNKPSEHLIMGGVIGFLSTTLLFGVLPDDTNHVIFRYQTLVAGLIALAASLITAVFLYAQIKQNKALADERKNADYIAARVQMPIAVDELTKYARQTLQMTKDMCQGLAIETPLPSLHNEVFHILGEVARAAPEEEADHIQRVTETFQVQNAQLRGWLDEYEPENIPDQAMEERANNRAIILNGGMFETVNLNLYIDELWNIARTNDSAAPTNESRAERAQLLLLPQQSGWVTVHWNRFFEVFIQRMNRSNDD